MEVENVYVPKWLSQHLLDGDIRREDIFSLAEKEYGKMSIEDRELLSDYLNDLIEDGFIYQIGNLIYKKRLEAV